MVIGLIEQPIGLGNRDRKVQNEFDEIQVLKSFIQWSSEDAYTPEKVKKIRIQSLVSALLCWTIAGGIFFYQPVDRVHIISISLLVIGVALMFPGSFYGNGSHAFHYTKKYIDIESAKARLSELEEINSKRRT